MINVYEHEYDDPYSFLACHIISKYTNNSIRRVLTEDDFIRKLVIKEIRDHDFNGPFSDVAIETILVGKRRMEYMRQLDLLAEYFYENIDKDRLRNKIIKYCHIYNIMEV